MRRRQADTRPESPSRPGTGTRGGTPMRRVPAALVITGFTGAVLLVTRLLGDRYFTERLIRPFFDHIDLAVYFREGAWSVAPGRLPYRDIDSEYPPVANLVFGAVRWIADRLAVFADPFDSFSWWWIGFAAAGYAFVAVKLAGEGRLALAAWLSPAILYFSLLRFDLYPAAAGMLALWAIRKERYLAGALWLGLCIALKGYAAVVLPAFGVFLIYRAGWRRAVLLSAVALVPMLASLAVVWAYAGLEGVLMPFLFHAGRPYNEETIYVAVNTLLGGAADGPLEQMRQARVPMMLQAGFGLLAAALRPRTFSTLVHAWLVAISGFVTASVFHSPQFALWIVAVAVFSAGGYTLWVAVALGWVTYLYFPILFDLRAHAAHIPHIRGAYEASILAIAVLQLAIMVHRPRGRRLKPAGGP